MMLGGEHRIMLVIGRMLGIIGLFLLRFICILQSKWHLFLGVVGIGILEFGINFDIVFCRLWLSHWTCMFSHGI